MAHHTVDDLLRRGRIETVVSDVAAAWARVDEAKRHLSSAGALRDSDPALAYVALYDAARKSITAHMQAHGYRASNRAGAHQAVGLYAERVLAIGPAAAHVQALTACA